MVADRQLDSLGFPCPSTDTDPPQLTTSPRTLLFLASALAFTSIVLTACPSSSPTPVSIDRVDVMGDPTSIDYNLKLTGRGFGPTSIRYDLSSGIGMATADLRLEINDQQNIIHVTIMRDALTVRSQGEIDARVVDNPLKPAIYTLRLYPSVGTQVIATKLFTVSGGTAQGDTGVGNVPDGGIDTNLDATTTSTVPPGGDSGVSDDTGGSVDLGTTGQDGSPGSDDGQASDTGISPDGGSPPDSGLGPFIDGYQYRQRVNATNPSMLPAPTGTTIGVTIPLQTMARLGQAKPDGSDVALYLGSTLLDSQFDDVGNLTNDQVLLLAKLPVDLPIGPIPDATPLVLYFGNPQTTVVRSDAIFLFAERFTADVPTAATPTALQWGVNGWLRCDRNNPPAAPAAGATGGAYCYQGTGTAANKRSISTPNITTVTNPPPQANLTYEVGFGVAGKMVQADLLYFAYGATHLVTDTTVPEPGVYLTNPPNVTGFTFTDNNAVARTVSGYRFPAATPAPFTRSRARFVPNANQTTPTLHFRFLALTGLSDDGTYVGIEDLTVRQALNPDFTVTLGPLETR